MARLVIALLCVPALASAGTVLDGTTLSPVAGATVSAGGRSVTTAADGSFTLDAELVTVSAPGYETATERIENGTVVVFPEGALAEVVTIEDRAPHRDSTVLSREEVRYQPGGGSDGLAAVRSLPGIGTAPPTAGGRLVIRGAAPQDSLLEVNGVPVPFLYHSFNYTTILPVEMIGAIGYAPGGFGVDEGRATGGVVGITTEDSHVDRCGGEASASFTEVYAHVVAPLGKAAGFRAGVRRSTVDLLAPVAVPDDLMIGFTTPPRFYDAYVQVDARPTEHDRVALLAFTSYDRLGIVNTDPISDLPEELSATGRFGRAIASWKHAGRVDNRLVGALGADGWDTDLGAGQYMQWTHAMAMIRDDASAPIGDRITVRAGMFAGLDGNDVHAKTFLLPSEGLPAGRLDDLPIRMIDTRYDANIAAGYAAADVAVTDHATITSGARVEYYAHTRTARVQPRMQLAWQRGPVNVRGALGIYTRDPDGLEGVSVAMRPESATQATLATEWAIADGISLAGGAFYTARRDLVVEDMTPGPLPYHSGGRGRSRGAELLVRAHRGDSFAWLAYSFSRSERDDGPFTPVRPTATDQPHVLTAVASTKRGAWRYGARWQLSSGLPYTAVTSTMYVPEVDRYIPTLGPQFAARYPTSHQLDLRVERTWQRKGWRLIGFVDVANTYRNGRVVRYQYDPTYTTKKPIEDMIPLPSVGVRAER